MRILVTGTSGMLGWAVFQFLKLNQDFEIFGTGTKALKELHKDYLPFDLSLSDYAPLVEWSKPDVIIHCAAITNMDSCEKNPEFSYLINSDSVKKFAIKVNTLKTRFVFISSDAVFSDDSKQRDEKQSVSPKSIYGKSKVAGESNTLSLFDRGLVIRTTPLGYHKYPIETNRSFMEWLLTSAIEQNRVSLFYDSYFTPIAIWDLAREIDWILKSSISEKILHLSGSERISKLDFGKRVIEMMGMATCEIVRKSVEEQKFLAPRTKDQVLDCSLFESLRGKKTPGVNETISSLIKRAAEFGFSTRKNEGIYG